MKNQNQNGGTVYSSRNSKLLSSAVGVLVILILAGIGSRLTTMLRAASVYTVPTDIVADCSIDVTAALNNWIASVPNSSVLSFTPNACYRIDNVLSIPSRSNLTFEGNNATFKAVTEGTSGRSHWVIARSTNITVRQVIVIGANPHAGLSDEAYRSALENQHGFQISGSNTVRLESVKVSDVFGDFVYLGNSGTTGWSRNITITGGRFERNGRQGVGLAAVDGVLIENNFFDQMRRATFDIEPNSVEWGVKNVKITNNQIGAGRLILLPITGAKKEAPVSDIEFSNNRISGQDLQIYLNPPTGARRARIIIKNNTSTSKWDCSTCSLIILRRVDGVVVEGNTQNVNPRNKLTIVSVSDGTGVRVLSNNFTGAGTIMKADAASNTYCMENNLPAVPTTIPKCTLPVSPPPPTGGSTSNGTSTTSTSTSSQANDSGSSASSPGDPNSPSANNSSNSTSNTAEQSDATPTQTPTKQVAAVTGEVAAAPFNAVDKVIGAFVGTPTDENGNPKSFGEQSLTRRIIVATITSLLLGVVLFFGSRLARKGVGLFWHSRLQPVHATAHHATSGYHPDNMLHPTVIQPDSQSSKRRVYWAGRYAMSDCQSHRW